MQKAKLSCRSAVWLALFLLARATPAPGIIIRHDRDDGRYLELAKSYSQLVHMNTQEPGKPPDGEGTLVDFRWVATAAHIATLIKPGHLVTLSGRDYEVAAVHMHPEWNDGPHDIALIRLASEVSGVEPALIYRQQDEAGQLVTLVGIGDTGTGVTGPERNDGRVRAATNRIESATEAWLKFPFDQGDKATELEGISGPGDSGGPAFIDDAGKRYLVGIGSGQSTRATGGREGLYGVTEYYTRVSTYAPWMDSIMNDHASDEPQAVESGATIEPVETPEPIETAKTSAPARTARRESCTGTLAEYCERYGGVCPTYDEALEWRSKLCSQRGSWSVTTRACDGGYRQVRWNESLLGGGEEYFNAEGQLVAASLHTDYPAYCNRTSFTQTFGNRDACPARQNGTQLCKR